MRFKRQIRSEKALRNMDFTPLIDVIFLLLIFFMLTSSFIFQPGIRVNLPRAITSEALSEENTIITITAENLTYIDGKLVTLNEMETVLKQASGLRKTVLIKADEKSSLGRVVKIWDLCRKTGIAKVNIATNQSSE